MSGSFLSGAVTAECRFLASRASRRPVRRSSPLGSPCSGSGQGIRRWRGASSVCPRATARGRWLACCGLLLGALASAGSAAAGPGPSELLYPLPGFPVPYAHAPHLGEGRLACPDCHPRAADSSSAAERLLPGPERCSSCHPAAAPAVAGEGAPLPQPPEGSPPDAAWPAGRPLPLPEPGDLPAPAFRAEPRLIFSHRGHRRAGVPCTGCHPVASPASSASRPQPLMEDCKSCHRERGAPLLCRSCHPIGPDGRLQTRFAAPAAVEHGRLPGIDPRVRLVPPAGEGLLRPRGTSLGASHDSRWDVDHGRVAGGDAKLCEACHDEQWCRRCHAGRFRPLMLHPAGWLEEHAAAAQGGELRCQSCHRLASFCRTCHQRLGVVARGESSPRPFAATARFHPTGWAALSGVGPGHHGEAARRNIGPCISCHAEQTCIRCHRSRDRRGLGIDPHPPGIGSRCRTLLAANPRGCLRCHVEDLEHDPRCR